MFLEVWELIQARKYKLAEKKLALISPANPYQKHIITLLKAEIALNQGKFKTCLNLIKSAYRYFSSKTFTLKDLKQDLTDLRLNCLECCYLQWIYARGLAGQDEVRKAQLHAENAWQAWVFYSNARLPFISFDPLEIWGFLPQIPRPSQ